MDLYMNIQREKPPQEEEEQKKPKPAEKFQIRNLDEVERQPVDQLLDSLNNRV